MDGSPANIFKKLGDEAMAYVSSPVYDINRISNLADKLPADDIEHIDGLSLSQIKNFLLHQCSLRPNDLSRQTAKFSGHNHQRCDDVFRSNFALQQSMTKALLGGSPTTVTKMLHPLT